MLALISPAKRLDFERDTDGPTMTQPALWTESKLLLKRVEKNECAGGRGSHEALRQVGRP